MGKRSISVIMAFCVGTMAVICNPMQTVSAAGNKLNSEDVMEILEDVTTAGQAWDSLGFCSDDIASLTQTSKNTNLHLGSIENQICSLSVETEETRALEHILEGQESAGLYAINGNPPQSPQEQNERMKYITEVALNKYGNTYGTENFSKYILYLYMSHYIDNPNYTKENPGFNRIYAYVITSDDITAYENFISQSKFSMFSTNTVNFFSELQSAGSNLGDLKQTIKDGKVLSINTANAVYGLSSFDPEKTVRRADLILTSFKNHYENESSVENLLNAIYADLEPEDVEQQYIDTCVTGLLGILGGSTGLFGFGMSISLCAYNYYMNLFDQARLVALQYSLSGRMAIRLDEIIWG